MIRVSHELPIQLLEDGTDKLICDYTYALVHLFDHHPSYFNYMRQCLIDGREVILDNSAFELGGEAYEMEGFIYQINRLIDGLDHWQISCLTVVIPDYFDDMLKTIKSANTFPYTRINGRPQFMVVAQGTSLREKVECYDVLSGMSWVDIIGLNYASRAYLVWEDSSSLSTYDKQAQGRKMFVEMLYNKGFLQRKANHILGTPIPSELYYYTTEHKELSTFIRSVDTSSPVVSGIFDEHYTILLSGQIIASPKRSEKLADFIDSKISNDQRNTIIRNSMLFRQLNRIG